MYITQTHEDTQQKSSLIRTGLRLLQAEWERLCQQSLWVSFSSDLLHFIPEVGTKAHSAFCFSLSEQEVMWASRKVLCSS